MDIGGQAVIEGVMMRNRHKFAVAVRLESGEIRIKKDESTLLPKYLNFPFLRGALGLGYMLYDGVRALIWSNNEQLGKDEQLRPWEVIGTLLLSFLMAITFFVVLPFFTARFIHAEGWIFDALDGLFRVILFVGYLFAISYMQDVKRLFQYHGAEHKAIACYEAKKELNVENVRSFSRFHPRCGTSFIFIVLLLSIILFSIISGPWWVELVGRFLLIPVIASVAYELIKLSGKFAHKPLVKILIAPGLWLQRLTTREPTDKQLEVGIASLKAVL